MKALTIIQPWATLIALGEKRFETRSWPTNHRGPIAIHASKKVDQAVCESEPFRSVLAEHGYTADNLPTGSIVATCNLVHCLKIDSNAGNYASLENDTRIVDGNELDFGWYGVGRYAWELADVHRLLDPLQAKGQQRLWTWNEN